VVISSTELLVLLLVLGLVVGSSQRAEASSSVPLRKP
jgi:hypothetical protein